MLFEGEDLNEVGPVVTAIRKMPKSVARAWLKRQHPQYSHIHGKLLDLLPEEPVYKHNYKYMPDYDPHRRHFEATAWCLGASYKKLGKMFGVSPQTILSQVDRLLPVTDGKGREEVYRIASGGIDDTYLHRLRDMYYGLIAEDDRVFDHTPPSEAAAMLRDMLSMQREDVDESYEYAELNAPDRKIG